MGTSDLTQRSDRRRHHRLKLRVAGRFMMPDRTEHRCVTVDMSPGGVMLQSLVLPFARQKIIVYLDELGRLEGEVTRVLRDRFSLQLTATSRKMDRTAASLTWIANREGLGLSEHRRSERFELAQPGVMIQLGEGRQIAGRVLDLAEHGAAIAVPYPLAVGERVSVGRAEARVIRVFDRGCAVEFCRPLSPGNLTSQL